MSRYAWAVLEFYDEDSDTFKPTHVPVRGPSDATEVMLLQAQAGIGRWFELRDGDGQPIARGYLAGAADGFEPLDDYGEGALGAASIWYYDKGWEQL